MNQRAKFIAGAVCPNCSDTDSLMLDGDNQSISCVSCDYSQSSEQRDEAKSPSKDDATLISVKNLS